MEIINDINELKNKIKLIKTNNKSIGFVPTMGYLHEGHMSLIERARKENDIIVVSIFVNPIQFSPEEDYEKYPRDEKHDSEMCLKAGCDIVFMPQVMQMYPEGFNTHIEVSELTEGLCGASRPGHFKGVCTVVTKLFNIIKPNRAYFGQKDAQQLAVIKKMVKDLDMDIEIVGCPIVREPDGLAMSSRNSYLSEDERKQALVLSRALNLAKELISQGNPDVPFLKNEMLKLIKTAKGSVIDYVEFVNLETLKPVNVVKGEVLIALAVKIGKTRLIDNMVVKK